jgi:hypothetical protein
MSEGSDTGRAGPVAALLLAQHVWALVALTGLLLYGATRVDLSIGAAVRATHAVVAA